VLFVPVFQMHRPKDGPIPLDRVEWGLWPTRRASMIKKRSHVTG